MQQPRRDTRQPTQATHVIRITPERQQTLRAQLNGTFWIAAQHQRLDSAAKQPGRPLADIAIANDQYTFTTKARW